MSDQIDQLTHFLRIRSIKSWGLSFLQIAAYVALGLTGIYLLNKIGIFDLLKKCLPTKLCIHLLCCNAKNNIQNIATNPTPLNNYTAILQTPQASTKLKSIRYHDEEEQIEIEPARVQFHRSIPKKH